MTKRQHPKYLLRARDMIDDICATLGISLKDVVLAVDDDAEVTALHVLTNVEPAQIIAPGRMFELLTRLQQKAAFAHELQHVVDRTTIRQVDELVKSALKPALEEIEILAKQGKHAEAKALFVEANEIAYELMEVNNQLEIEAVMAELRIAGWDATISGFAQVMREEYPEYAVDDDWQVLHKCGVESRKNLLSIPPLLLIAHYGVDYTIVPIAAICEAERRLKADGVEIAA